jgi:hypothetical protein
MDKVGAVVAHAPVGAAAAPLQVVGLPTGTVLVAPHTQGMGATATQEVGTMTWFGPGWIPRSTPFRLVVPFYPAACCTMGGGGLNAEQEVPLNQVLLQRGGPDAVAKWVTVKPSSCSTARESKTAVRCSRVISVMYQWSRPASP